MAILAIPIQIGRELLLKGNGIDDPTVLAAVGEHHERLDGTGYPDRRAARPIQAPNLLKNEAEQGKFDPEKLRRFSYSLL